MASGGGGNNPYEDGIPRPALAVHPHHFALQAIETAFNNAAGLRGLAAQAAAGLHQQQQDPHGLAAHMGGVSGLHPDSSGIHSPPPPPPHQHHQLHHQQELRQQQYHSGQQHHQPQQHHPQQQQTLPHPEMNVLSPASSHDGPKYNPATGLGGAPTSPMTDNQTARNVMSPVMPLDVQLTEGPQARQPDSSQQRNSLTNESTQPHSFQQQQPQGMDDEDEEDEDEEDEEDLQQNGKQSADEKMPAGVMIKTEITAEDDELPEEPDEDPEDPKIVKLRQLVEEIGDASLIWRTVRSRILNQCQIWDLLMDKACFRYYGEAIQDDQKPKIDELDLKSKRNLVNSKKFKAVLSEMEVLLGEFKCLMDGCLKPYEEPTSPPQNAPENRSTSSQDDDNKQPPPEIRENAADCKENDVEKEVVLTTGGAEICLSPELSRAYDQPIAAKWNIKTSEEINALYQHFFNETAKDKKEAMLNAEVMFNAFMPFGNKFDVSGYLDEDYGGGGSYEMEEDYDESEDVKPQIGGGVIKKERTTFQDPSIYIYECQTCPRRYKHQNNLKRHETLCKGEPIVENDQWKKTLDGRYYCTFSGCVEPDRNWSTLQGVQQHFNQVHARPEDLQFPCDFCEIKFSSKNLLNYHRKIKHSTRYPCTQCGKEFPSQTVLERHTQVHLGNAPALDDEQEIKPFKCDLCDYRTSAHNGVALHKRSAHNVDKHNRPLAIEDNPDHHKRDEHRFAYSCERCTRRYKSTKNLLRHQKNCSGVPPPNVKPTWRKDPLDGRYYCTFQGCNTAKNWTCSSGVWKHYNSEHADVADPGYCVYPCDMCDERFPTKTMYNQHRKHKHLALFQYTCTVCGKRLPSTLRLKLHMRLHTGEKPYKCELCEYRSATQSAVNQHKMRMHEEHSHIALQRHVCEICGKSFKVKSNLKEHVRSHSDARTFLCGFCGKALKNRQCLNRHLFTHGVKYTCQNCGKNFANPSSLHVHRRDKHGIIQ